MEGKKKEKEYKEDRRKEESRWNGTRKKMEGKKKEDEGKKESKRTERRNKMGKEEIR